MTFTKKLIEKKYYTNTTESIEFVEYYFSDLEMENY